MRLGVRLHGRRNVGVPGSPYRAVERLSMVSRAEPLGVPNTLLSQYALNGVSCVSASACVAVGSTFTYGGGIGGGSVLVGKWDGKSWSAEGGVDGAGGRLAENVLSGVSCTSASRCVAVGSDTPPGESRRPS